MGLSPSKAMAWPICPTKSYIAGKEVYQRHDHHDDSLLPRPLWRGHQMALMEQGNFQNYLNNHKPPDQSLKLAWFHAIARALVHVHVHDRRVLAADIATQNFLLSASLDVKLSDIKQSRIFLMDTDMEIANHYDYSIFTGIGQLGAVFYTVATGQAWELYVSKDLPYEPTDIFWRRRKDLPSTENT